MENSPGYQLERYSQKHPQEVLRVRALVAGEPDEILIFRGFSSSLMRPTARDPELPMLPESAQILSIDRLVAPYSPQAPQYYERDLSWGQMLLLLTAAGI